MRKLLPWFRSFVFDYADLMQLDRDVIGGQCHFTRGAVLKNITLYNFIYIIVTIKQRGLDIDTFITFTTTTFT